MSLADVEVADSVLAYVTPAFTRGFESALLEQVGKTDARSAAQLLADHIDTYLGQRPWATQPSGGLASSLRAFLGRTSAPPANKPDDSRMWLMFAAWADQIGSKLRLANHELILPAGLFGWHQPTHVVRHGGRRSDFRLADALGVDLYAQVALAEYRATHPGADLEIAPDSLTIHRFYTIVAADVAANPKREMTMQSAQEASLDAAVGEQVGLQVVDVLTQVNDYRVLTWMQQTLTLADDLQPRAPWVLHFEDGLDRRPYGAAEREEIEAETDWEQVYHDAIWSWLEERSDLGTGRYPDAHEIWPVLDDLQQYAQIPESARAWRSAASAVEAANHHGLVEGCLRRAHSDYVDLAAEAASCSAEVARIEIDLDRPTPIFDEALALLSDAQQDVPELVRVGVAKALGMRNDPRLRAEQRWVWVPPGDYWRGVSPNDQDADTNESPSGWMELPGFYAQRWPVTVEEMRRFDEAAASDRRWWSERGWAWRTSGFGRSLPAMRRTEQVLNRPVTGVSWWECEAYARWLSDQPSGTPGGATARLPTESEWEKLARGGRIMPDGTPNPAPQRVYAWGESFDARCCCGGRRYYATAPVGCFPAGHNALGLWDVTGNVQELCLDTFDSHPQAWDGEERATQSTQGPGDGRICRGGDYESTDRALRVSARHPGGSADIARDGVGFRLVALP